MVVGMTGDRFLDHHVEDLWQVAQATQANFSEKMVDLAQATSRLTSDGQLSFAANRDRLVQTVVDATNQAASTVSAKTTHAVDTIDTAASQTVSYVADHVANTAGQATAALSIRMQGFGNIGGSIADSVQASFTDTANTWLEAHPIAAWFITHPFMTILAMLLLIWLGWGLLRAIAQLSERVWLAIFRIPFRLGQWLMQASVRGRQPVTSANQTALLPEHMSQQEKLTALLNRLESIRQEQDELLKEVQAILTLKE